VGATVGVGIGAKLGLTLTLGASDAAVGEATRLGWLVDGSVGAAGLQPTTAKARRTIPPADIRERIR